MTGLLCRRISTMRIQADQDRNVFCRPLEDICVAETNALYRRLDERGVAGFHFVVSPSPSFPRIRRQRRLPDVLSFEQAHRNPRSSTVPSGIVAVPEFRAHHPVELPRPTLPQYQPVPYT